LKKTLFLILLSFPVFLYGQKHSWDGMDITPNARIRCLNIFVNIIYDIHPEYNDPFTDTIYWPPVTNPSLEGINNAAIPRYLMDWMDTAYVEGQTHGYCTRLYGESSFDSLQITGDFVVVNLCESTVCPQPWISFTANTIGKKVVNLINVNGLQTIYGHNKISDYDHDQDGKIDFLNLIIRNIKKPYSDINPGSGYGKPLQDAIVIDGVYYTAKAGTIQCVGDGNFYANPTNIVTHEISHTLFGDNDFHTSGGNHRGGGCSMSFLNIQGGYGLMGAAGSGLVSCNGYERWRMHWKHPQAVDYISARDADNTLSVVSDISKEDGNTTFLLRDFITYGDVIRIKLPYKDSITSSNQYIWLENHQVGSNGKLDFLQYSNTHSCRPQGKAGIYAYYQVGRDIIEGDSSQVWDSYDRDNLKIIPAEGYYDYEWIADTHYVNCVNYDEHYIAVRRGNTNPLCGGQDQEFLLFPEVADTVLSSSREFGPWRKYIDTIKDDHLPKLGDNLDAFSTHTVINMGTNPSTNNAKTYHSNFRIIRAQDSQKNTQTTYLTGLSIEMMPLQGTGNFLVNIRWDDYDITNDTRWTGKIALKDTAILTEGNTITLAQNRTVAQPTRDPETGLFAGRTRWTCESGSYFRQDSASSLVLTENSSLFFESGSCYDLSKGARVEVHEGCSLTVREGAKIQLLGTIEVDSGGVLTLYDTAKMGNVARLIVRPGGKLIVDGGTLTSACDGVMWQGIEVVGDRTKRQLAQYQGTVELKNGARIENAMCAIRTGGLSDTVHYFTTGGIISAENTTFRNNRQSVVINSYAYTAPSGGIANYNATFSRCTLKVDNSNLFAVNNVAFSEHVKLWDVKGVLFRGCVFENNTSNPLSSGRGIYAEDAGLEVEPYCPRPLMVNECECPASLATYGSFSGFTAAVEVNTSGNSYPVRIDGTSFSNNGTGVRINSNNYVSVTRNTFNLDSWPLSSRSNVGLYLNTCTGYLVEDNTFERTNYPSGQYFIDNSTGICVENSGIFFNSLYRNQFSKLTSGISISGTNGNLNRGGLQMTCNLFAGGKRDIYLNNGANVSYIQGSPSKGADNVFLSNTLNISNFYNSSAFSIIYYYDNSDNILYPTNYTNLNPIGIHVSNDCSSTLCDNGIPGGGGGQYLTGFQSDMNAFSTASANQSPADGTDGGDQTLSEAIRVLSETYYTAVRALMADSVLDLSALEQWHTAAQPIADPYSLTETRFMEGYAEPFVAETDDAELANYAEFHAMKLALRNGNLNDNADNQDNHNLQYSPTINWYALTDAQIAQLQTIAERNTGRASVMAKGVLCFFFGICYDDDLFVDDNLDNQDNAGNQGNQGDAETRSAKAAQQDGKSHLNVYPNPTDDVLYVELSGAGIQSVGLYDLQGRAVGANNHSPLQGTTATLSLKSVPVGVYLLRVMDENGREYHRKVVVK